MASEGVFSPRWNRVGRYEDEVHVLAVDDSLVDRKAIERLLKITSCKVTAVDSGIRALEFLGSDVERESPDFYGLKVDLIITDYCMPGMTGYELLKKIKESLVFREIPVVIMSSEKIVTRIDRCLKEGAEDFIVKPVKLSDVERLRKDYMSKESKHVKNNVTNKRKSRDIVSDSSPSPPSGSSNSSSVSTSLSSSPSNSDPSSPKMEVDANNNSLDALMFDSPTSEGKMDNPVNRKMAESPARQLKTQQISIQ